MECYRVVYAAAAEKERQAAREEEKYSSRWQYQSSGGMPHVAFKILRAECMHTYDDEWSIVIL